MRGWWLGGKTCEHSALLQPHCPIKLYTYTDINLLKYDKMNNLLQNVTNMTKYEYIKEAKYLDY